MYTYDVADTGNRSQRKPYTVNSHYLKFQGLSETLRDIRTSTYLSCGSEENNKSNNHI